jgi:hypothetical protein
MTTPLPGPGWYPDPGGGPGSIYWDGQRWVPAAPHTPGSVNQRIPATVRRSPLPGGGRLYFALAGLVLVFVELYWLGSAEGTPWLLAVITLVTMFFVAAMSIGASLGMLKTIPAIPGWAFTEAHRMPKSIWLLLATIGLVPPLGLVFAVIWRASMRAVYEAWKAGDPAGAAGHADLLRIQLFEGAVRRGVRRGLRG